MSEEIINDEPFESTEAPKKRSRLSRPGWKILGAVLLIALLWNSPTLIRKGLSQLDFFRLKKIEVQGIKYLQASDVVARLRADTMRSIWDDNDDLLARLKGHPQITSAVISRKMPSTLVVKIHENLPVALIPTQSGLEPYDSLGHALPIDPSKADIDAPIVAVRDPALLRFLGGAFTRQPAFYARVSEVRRTGRTDFAVVLDSALVVRFPLGSDSGGDSGGDAGGMPLSRVPDIFPVERDLAKRQVASNIVEIDLRYRDQVIARLK